MTCHPAGLDEGLHEPSLLKELLEIISKISELL